MLVLSRKKNESFSIGLDISVVVVEIRDDKVRLGIDAPREVPVHRSEVLQAVIRDGGVDHNGCAPFAIWQSLLDLRAENERLKAELASIRQW